MRDCHPTETQGIDKMLRRRHCSTYRFASPILSIRVKHKVRAVGKGQVKNQREDQKDNHCRPLQPYGGSLVVACELCIWYRQGYSTSSRKGRRK